MFKDCDLRKSPEATEEFECRERRKPHPGEVPVKEILPSRRDRHHSAPSLFGKSPKPEIATKCAYNPI